ncbi:UNVERIFIED_CONTAM: hypothetical protein FKN15_040296 [Acipenser sinensis]
MGRVLRPQFPLCMAGTGEHGSFNLAIQVKNLNHEVLVQFSVKTPGAAPKSADKYQQRRFQRRKEVGRSAPIPERTVLKCPKFQDRTVNISRYGIALKSVLRQPKIEYLLEYFKGDTIALLGLEKVKAIGLTKVKEWYIGFLRGKVGLVHCKNVKALLKIDCQGLVARLTQNTVILTTAVELGIRWRELAEKASRLTKAQIDGYEAPHKGKNGEVGTEAMWKPAYDFMYTWSSHYGDGYRDVLQDLHLALDKMKSPVTRHWRQLTGALILVNCMDILRANAFPTTDEEQKHLQ